MRYGFVIDQRKCIGCHACTVACKEEHQVPLGVNRTWVKYIEKGTFPDTRRYFSVMRCNHCDNAPCVTICPTVALYRRPDGIVDFDGERCIGCKSCLQACPYDALYIDPATRTAAKCNYCAHRVEVGLEPACVIICPVQAIVTGDLDDPGSALARLVAGQQVQVRKPEQGTQPKLFYLGAEAAALTPEMQRRGTDYAFAQVAAIPAPGRRARPAQRHEVEPDRLEGGGDEPVDLLQMARTVYDVGHPDQPWGGKVSAYLWTKSVASGAMLMAAIGLLMGVPGARGALTVERVGKLTAYAAPLLALVFLALTTALLVADLKRPERFLYLLFKPNWRSWLVWGGWILIAFGAVAGLWLAAAWTVHAPWLPWLVWPAIALALAAAGYSAFLFGQAEGRDFWQSPLLLPHLLVSALLAGAAIVLIASWVTGVAQPVRELGALAVERGVALGDMVITVLASYALAVSLLVHGALVFAECWGPHGTRDARRAAHVLTEGPLRGALLIGVGFLGIALPLALLMLPWASARAGAAVLALLGLWLWDDLFVRAGQAVPLS